MMTTENLKYIIDTIYPIGSIYISKEYKSPASFLGGSWEYLENNFIYHSWTRIE